MFDILSWFPCGVIGRADVRSRNYQNFSDGLDYLSSSPFSLRDSRASETQARVKITPRANRRHAAGREKNEHKFKSLGFVCSPSFFSLPAACRLFSHGVIFTRACVSLAPLSPAEEKWGTTRSLQMDRLPNFLRYGAQLASASRARGVPLSCNFCHFLKALRRCWMMNLKIDLFTFTAFHVLISVVFVVKLMKE